MCGSPRLRMRAVHQHTHVMVGYGPLRYWVMENKFKRGESVRVQQKKRKLAIPILYWDISDVTFHHLCSLSIRLIVRFNNHFHFKIYGWNWWLLSAPVANNVNMNFWQLWSCFLWKWLISSRRFHSCKPVFHSFLPWKIICDFWNLFSAWERSKHPREPLEDIPHFFLYFIYGLPLALGGNDYDVIPTTH